MIDSLEKYLEEIGSREREINEQDFNEIDNDLHKEYLFVKAGYQYLLGEDRQVPEDFFQQFFRKNALYKKVIELDLMTEYHVTQNLITAKGDTSFFDDIKDKPRIFCTFHFGAYQSIVTYLKLHYVDLFIVTIKGYKINEIIAYDATKEEFSDKDIDSIKSTSFTSLIDLSNKLREGKSIVVFLDRQDISNNPNEKISIVDLFGREIKVKRGIPEISFIRNVPIIPVVCYRNSFSDTTIHFHPEEQKMKGENKNDYSVRVLQNIFNVYAGYIKSYPEQWEYWSDLHHIIDLDKIPPPPEPVGQQEVEEAAPQKKSFFGRLFSGRKRQDNEERESLQVIRFNESEYGIYKEREETYLLNISNFSCYKISPNLSFLIRHVQVNNLNWQSFKSIVNETLYADLKKKRIFI